MRARGLLHMEDGFHMLDEFSDDQALERQLESFLDDASDHLPVRIHQAFRLPVYMNKILTAHAI